jgi:predicted  nucleic acid-binding Zn-ribbon protein
VDWREELRKALRLQEADRRCDALRAERNALLHDAQEASLDRDRRVRAARIAGAEEELADLERRQRLADLERKSLEEERARATRRLYGGDIRTARDADGLQKNIDGASKQIDELETAILEAMERAEAVRKGLDLARAELARVEAALADRREANRARLGQVDAQLPLDEAARAAEARRLEPAVLREYERLRPRCAGIAVAPAGGGSCGACGFQLSAYWQEKLRESATAPVTCEHCGRMLVDA